MARVQVRLPPAMTGGQMTQVAPRNDQSTQVKEKPKYTVTMEQVTEKKKKLLSQTSYKIQPPPGFTFVVLKETALTDKCKELSRLGGRPIHIVSSSRGGKRSSELSQQVGRVGHHFSSEIVNKALTYLGQDMDGAGRLRDQLEKARKTFGTEIARKDQTGSRIGEGITNKAELNKLQEKLSADARAMLNTLFPRMPKKDVKIIIKHAFTIGKDRIGSSAEVPLDRRVHLAVMAHIRHMYTGYDKLLQQVPYQTARSIVEKDTLAKIIEWRGEDDKDAEGAVEDILREVIVIDDDDDDEQSDDADDDLEFSSHQVPADQIDNHPSMNMAPSNVDYSRYAYGRGSTRMIQLYRPEDRERMARHDAARQQRYRDLRQEIRDGRPKPIQQEYREYVPIQENVGRVSRPLYDDRVPVFAQNSPRMLSRDEFGRERELIPLHPERILEGPSTMQSTRSNQMGGRFVTAHDQRPLTLIAHPGPGTDTRPMPAQPSPPKRQGEVVHPSIEAAQPEIIELDSPRSNRGHEERSQQFQSTSDHRYQNVHSNNHVQHPGTVLGKRPRYEEDLPQSPMKAQRTEHHAQALAIRPQMVTLSQAEHPQYGRHSRDDVVTMSRPNEGSALYASRGEGERRYAQPTRRPSDQPIRQAAQNKVIYIDSSPRQPHSPNQVVYSPTHRPTTSNGAIVQRLEGMDVNARPAPTHNNGDRTGAHPEFPRQVHELNNAAYRRNGADTAPRPERVVRYEPIRPVGSGPRTPAGNPSYNSAVFHDGLPRSEPQRILYERRPNDPPMPRHSHSQSDLSRHVVEQPRFLENGKVISERYAPQMYDAHGRRIVILDAPH